MRVTRTEALLVQIQCMARCETRAPCLTPTRPLVNLNQKKEKLARQTVKASQDTLSKWSTATNEYYTTMDAKWCEPLLLPETVSELTQKRTEIQAKYETPLKESHQKRLVLLKDIRKTLMDLEVNKFLIFYKIVAVIKKCSCSRA